MNNPKPEEHVCIHCRRFWGRNEVREDVEQPEVVFFQIGEARSRGTLVLERSISVTFTE